MAKVGEADQLATAISRLIGRSDWALELWDGRRVGPSKPAFTMRLNDRSALDYALSLNPERGFGRAYVTGVLDIEPVQPFLEAFTTIPTSAFVKATPSLVAAVLRLGGRPKWRGAAAAAEARLHGRRHTPSRDAEAIRHHYDLPESFYALWLDRTMTYSCAYYQSPNTSLDTAQVAKLDLVCRKLRLQSGERMLDIGSGFGSLALHAAREYGARVVGITLSHTQLKYAQRRARDEGLDRLVEFRLADYRDNLGTYDAVASVGMLEHVGRKRLAGYARAIHDALRPEGRALVHGITLPATVRWNPRSFDGIFVFPDGELEDIGYIDRTLELAGLEVRDVESLREHYARTLEDWAQRYDTLYEQAEQIAGKERARVWRMHLRGAAVAFALGTVSVHQTLAVRPGAKGRAGLPLTRDDWYQQTAPLHASNGSAGKVPTGAVRSTKVEKPSPA